jgi:tetrahydromethanopterin S-methyltransferase subunit G
MMEAEKEGKWYFINGGPAKVFLTDDEVDELNDRNDKIDKQVKDSVTATVVEEALNQQFRKARIK